MSPLKAAPNVSQLPPLPANNVEAMFQQIMLAVHKSVSDRVLVIIIIQSSRLMVSIAKLVN